MSDRKTTEWKGTYRKISETYDKEQPTRGSERPEDWNEKGRNIKQRIIKKTEKSEAKQIEETQLRTQ